MGKLMSWGGWGIFLFVFLGWVHFHGVRWEFGPYGLTHILVDESGECYLDHTPIDPITLALHRSGDEQAIQVVLIAVFVAVFFYLVLSVFRLQRLIARRRRMFFENAGLLPPKGHATGSSGAKPQKKM